MKKQRMIMLLKAAGLLIGLSAGLLACGTAKTGSTDIQETEKASVETFAPSLDTEQKVSLEIAGFLGNFEALDQVINDFNEFYPNVTVTYEQNNGSELADYMQNNKYVDIFMTADDNIHSGDDAKYAGDHCLDLSKEKINTSAIEPELIEACTVDGSLMRIPLARNFCGIVANTTLLEKESLEIPQNWTQFLDTCDALKQKGYTPIQSSKYHVNSDLMLPMAMTMIGTDDKVQKMVNSADRDAAEQLRPVYEKLEVLYQKGYIDPNVNEKYPDDNYDGSILNFFEGDVPFWVCTTECVSGMKKRESKSEAFTENPFDYEFMFPPLSEDGVYDYEEPWYGFSVNKDSDEADYAVEFLRYLTTEEELDKLAEIKGMPSAVADSKNEQYARVTDPAKQAARYVFDGRVKTGVTSAVADVSNQFGQGNLKNTDEMVEALQKRLDEMQ